MAGFDNQAYLAPDKAYAKLEACCRYERTGKSESADVKPAAHEHHAMGDAATKPAGQIPMPTLTFTEGDTAEIYVHNELDEETSLHWHG